MNTGMKNGKLVIDMAEADELWNGLTKDQQYDAMCAMFTPILDSATRMKRGLESAIEALRNDDKEAALIICMDALPK